MTQIRKPCFHTRDQNALKKCNECDNEVSTKAKKCPHCGVKVKAKTALTTRLVLFGFVYFVYRQASEPPLTDEEKTVRAQERAIPAEMTADFREGERALLSAGGQKRAYKQFIL